MARPRRDSYEEGWSEWASGARDLIAALGDSAQKLRGNADSFQGQDDAARDALARLRGPM